MERKVLSVYQDLDLNPERHTSGLKYPVLFIKDPKHTIQYMIKHIESMHTDNVEDIDCVVEYEGKNVVISTINFTLKNINKLLLSGQDLVLLLSEEVSGSIKSVTDVLELMQKE